VTPPSTVRLIWQIPLWEFKYVGGDTNTAKETVMKKVKVFCITAVVMLVLLGCARHDPERYFRAEPVDGGASVMIVEYLGDSWEVRIPPRIRNLPVTHIGNGAFANSNLTSVAIPNSVTYIGASAFSSNQLTSISIPNSVIEIWDGAFRNNQLTNVTIPSGVIEIGESAFRNNQLTSINIPDSVIHIWRDAFSNNQLTSVNIPNSVIEIWDGAFRSNQLTSVSIPDSVDFIGTGAFRNNQLTNVSIPYYTQLISRDSWGMWQPSPFDNDVTIIRR